MDRSRPPADVSPTASYTEDGSKLSSAHLNYNISITNSFSGAVHERSSVLFSVLGAPRHMLLEHCSNGTLFQWNSLRVRQALEIAPRRLSGGVRGREHTD